MAGRRTRLYSLVARLKPGVSQTAAQNELKSLSAALAAEFPETNAGWRAVAAPINQQLLGKLQPALLTLLGAAGFVLLIACCNVANLLMARGISRTRELAVRAALGASRARLAFQLMLESLILASAGGLLGLAVARAGLRLLLHLLPVRAVPVFPRMDEARLDPRALLVAMGITLFAALVFGLAPAWEFSSPATEPALQEGGRGHTGGRRRRRRLGLLIGMEAALSVILLAGAGLMLRSFLRAVAVQPGFHAEHVLTAQIPSAWKPGAANNPAEMPRKVQYFDELIARAHQIPGVTAAALTTNLPLASVQVQTIIRLEGRLTPRPGEEFRVGYSSISPEYFRVMGIPLLRGRALSADDSAGRPLVAVIDEAMARRFWPNEDPLGKQLSFNPAAGAKGPWMTVVGVAGNVRRFALTVEPDAQIYVPYAQSLLAPQTATLVLRAALDPVAVTVALQKTIHQIDPTQPVSEIKTLAQIVSDTLAQTRLYTVLLGIFAVIAVALAAAGIFSVISWTVSQSRPEIGIRMALGAAPRNVLGAMMGRAIAETVVGAGAGILGAIALTGFLKSQLYEVTALDPAVLVAAPVALVAVAASAAYLSARRALRVDPMSALR
jgi:predicted permease